MASKSTTPNNRSSLTARRKWYDENIKGGVGTNGMAYKRPGSNKK